MKATAFAPGHVTGFFAPFFNEQDLDRTGSIGAGINISLGAISEVLVEYSTKQKIEVFINNKKSKAPVTQYALKVFLGDKPIHVVVKTILNLPTGQGFGMSGAGVLSATYALAEILDVSKEKALKASHYAEVICKTGLGDVSASAFGGVEIRRKPGLPPWGFIEHIPCRDEIVCCVIGKQLNTRKILGDKSKCDLIKKHGSFCVDKILEKPSLENLFRLSNFFTNKTELADKKIIEAINTVNKQGMCSMCMLGNSVFAMGNKEKLNNILSKFGKTYSCLIDQYGARIIKK